MINVGKSLGVSLYSHNFYIPRYKVGTIGGWKINNSGITLCSGYYSGSTLIQQMPVVTKQDSRNPGQWNPWMAVTPMNIESREIAIGEASGHCVVMGLGIGWAVINMALKDVVKSVTVIEIDPDVIKLFQKSDALKGLNTDIIEKITIVNTDAMKWEPTKTIDFLFADIWEIIANPQAIDQVKEMEHTILAKNVYIWGQEILIYEAMDKEGRLDLLSDPAAIKEFSYGMFGLPLVVPEHIDYGEIIRRVMDNQSMHFSTS